MNVTVEFNFGEEKIYSRKLLTTIAQKTIEYSECIIFDDAHIIISVAFVSEKEMQRVNRDLRDRDSVTDVLSIGDYSDDKDISEEKAGEIFLGEVILCYNYIAQNSKENKKGIDQEFFTVYSHGILHLLGFAHGREMYALQDRISEEFGVK